MTLGRFVPYKNIDRIVRAFRPLPYPLLVVGDGPGRQGIKAMMKGQAHIRWFSYVCRMKSVGDLLQKSRAFVFMAEEDFGIAPLEAQSAGVPVIAWAAGGILETVPGVRVGETS